MKFSEENLQNYKFEKEKEKTKAYKSDGNINTDQLVSTNWFYEKKISRHSDSC